jgi:UDP-N-acetylmuramoyl-L-alanyl-D-glutamate--2,6-diaminopimelate ligase
MAPRPPNPIEKLLRILKRVIPKPLFRAAQPYYHYLLAFVSASLFDFPSREIRVVAITGTKGKTTVAELVNAILEAAGYKTALLSTIHFKTGDVAAANTYKMTVPGRFFVQKFLRDAVNAKCDWAVVEMTSEAVKQHRHAFIDFDALIFTNLAHEHIESHGSYEQYRAEKVKLARAVARSRKPGTLIVANADDKEAPFFLEAGAKRSLPYRLADGASYETTSESSVFAFRGRTIRMRLPGIFNIMNALGAATFAEAEGVPLDAIVKGLSEVSLVRGRVEYVCLDTLDGAEVKQPFSVVVDYAHTPESLEALYELFPETHIIAVLGNTGGGRDTWKRPVMAGIAEKHANEIILTNEDPYDENPQAILDAMAEGIEDKIKLSIILDRREAIHEALERAKRRSASEQPLPVVVLITGKGTDPYIMGANGSRVPWDDATVAREELEKIM